ncbi:transcription-repair coupling factor [Candidatus Obscuribacterales bacterium]|nr:transcription-repair coupling factor [Candidatus Obscuribacterales bacterium]MBX3138440.1 transcription-repair coupling factor [Candidatus Obscuribacterales bacterium]MBX3151612.1 transcription-repair coupling factor [Candidatus Obscuribacterales bacterium]
MAIIPETTQIATDKDAPQNNARKPSMRDNPLANALHQVFINSPNYARLLARTAKQAQTELNLAGLTDSAKTLVMTVLQHEIRRPMFLVVADNHSGAFFHQELNNLSRYPVFLYPSSEVSPYEQVLSSPDNVASQLEVLQNVSQQQQPYVVVVTARALMQRVLAPDVLAKNTLELKAGDAYDTTALANKLARLGYTREAMVTLRGEFSIRGDIIDIFPSSGSPVRIELFGDEVESVRVFNIDNQRSVEPRNSVIIPPRWWIILDSDEEERSKLVARLREVTNERIKELDDSRADTLRSVMENDLVSLASGAYPESVEYYAPYVHEQFATLLDYLPQDALIAFDEWDSIEQSLRSYEEKLQKAYDEGLETGRLLPLPRPLHMPADQVLLSSKSNQRVFLSSLPVFEESEKMAVVEFQAKPVDKFGNQMNVLVQKIKDWQREGKRVVISTEQPQRLMGIMKEWDCSSKYVPGPNDATVIRGTTDSAANINDETAPASDVAQKESVIMRHLEALKTGDNAVWVTRHGFIHGFTLEAEGLVSITDGEMFGLKRKPTVYRRPVAEKNYERFTSVADLKVDDYVVHLKQGIGQFVGVQRIVVDNQHREYLTIQYSGDDRLYVPVDQINMLSRYRGAGEHKPRLSRLGGAEWESTKKRVKRSVKQIAEDLVNLYAMRAKQEGFQCVPDTPWQYEMEEAFPFEETPDQWQAIVDVKNDLESAKPMDRLVCGDVGFGKTEVAIRGIFKTVMSGRQAAILVPTTILAQQHFNNIAERFAAFPIRVGLLSRFRSAKEQRDVVRRLATGECDVVVGTHRMLQKDIAFKDLGLVVIDEEHRFGVGHKEKLKQLRVMVDVLTMSATPIPRTLHMALSGARDMSLIHTPPINRSPVKTFVGEFKLPLVRTAILHEMERGGQIYFLHNRVETIEQMVYELKQLVPEARIIYGHGQMGERELENVMLSFMAHEFDILVCTTIIESGLDIPNTNTIIINEADRFGLAQLYQLRGRVGRSDVQAYCYCLYKPQKVITELAQSRLKAIREFTSLGSGYQIALRDMEIRGVGNILGGEQHGHMVSVGFDLYCKLLEESVSELKGANVSRESDSQIDINVTAYIPETYIQDNQQRLLEYKRLADVRNDHELQRLMEEWKDRFGTVPVEAVQLTKVIRLRLLATQAGVSHIKPDMQSGLRLSVAYRLQQWLPIQNNLPKHLARVTTYKPGIAGGQGSSPYIIVKADGTAPEDQLNLLEELLSAMVANCQPNAV